jgi:hypothetical protein
MIYHRDIKRIYIHHSASEFGDTETINRWHKERGFIGTAEYDGGEKHVYHVGYHFVITKNGIERGKPLDLKGEHVKGDNEHSIGICIIGTGDGETNTYTPTQIDNAVRLTSFLKMLYPYAEIKGHKEADKKKPHCPSIDMAVFRRRVFEESIRGLAI